jgi:hypothetical protein
MLQQTSVFNSLPQAELVEAGSAERYGHRLSPAVRLFQQGAGCLLTHASLCQTGFDRLSLRYRVGNKNKVVEPESVVTVGRENGHEDERAFHSCADEPDNRITLVS